MKERIKISEVDFLDFDLFSLKWRFTDTEHNSLPSMVLKEVKPLTNKKSLEVYGCLIGLLENFHLDEKKFKSIECLDNPHEIDASSDWLGKFIPKETEKVIVSWGQETSVLTQKDVFLKYWDDFCYPSSDDVFIVPLIGDWIIYYFHEDQFQFGRLFD